MPGNSTGDIKSEDIFRIEKLGTLRRGFDYHSDEQGAAWYGFDAHHFGKIGEWGGGCQDSRKPTGVNLPMGANSASTKRSRGPLGDHMKGSQIGGEKKVPNFIDTNTAYSNGGIMYILEPSSEMVYHLDQ